MADLLDALVIYPGDTLIVRVQGPLSRDVVDEMMASLEELLPGITPVIITAEQMLVYRPVGGDADG